MHHNAGVDFHPKTSFHQTGTDWLNNPKHQQQKVNLKAGIIFIHRMRAVP
jgi:hypothetical protein